jgi:D-alanine transaminase
VLPLAEARISPLDRGFLFADAVYEVMPVYAGRPFRFAAHFARLADSMAATGMTNPHHESAWRHLVGELIERNGGGDQYVYLQVSRGAHPERNPAPLPAGHTVFAFCAPWPQSDSARRKHGIAAMTAPDPRWARCDIKSVALLPNILLRQQALDHGAGEALMLRDGWLTEATSSAAHVVFEQELRTPPQTPAILPGTTRSVLEELAARCGVRYSAAPVSAEQLHAADEILLSSALRELDAVTLLDGRPVGLGRPGPVYAQLRAAFDALKQELADTPW